MRQAGAAVGLAGVVVCTGILIADYAVARQAAPRDEKLILVLQKQVREDAALAAKLEAEHKRITQARMARKARGGLVANVLIAAAALFLVCVQRVPWPARDPRPRSEPGLRAGRGRGRPPSASPEMDLVELVATTGRGKEAAIPLLQAIQAHYRYLPDDVLQRVCELTDITPAEIAGTSSFYARFRRSPAGRHVVRVCHGTACHVAGASQITQELRRHFRIPDGADTDPDRIFTLEEVACLGCCSLAPVLTVDGHTAGKLTPTTACEALGHEAV